LLQYGHQLVWYMMTSMEPYDRLGSPAIVSRGPATAAEDQFSKMPSRIAGTTLRMVPKLRIISIAPLRFTRNALPLTPNPDKPEPTGNGDDARFVKRLRYAVFLHYRYPKDI
jgi:hypothetical protein